jgi:hypothetical protein
MKLELPLMPVIMDGIWLFGRRPGITAALVIDSGRELAGIVTRIRVRRKGQSAQR